MKKILIFSLSFLILAAGVVLYQNKGRISLIMLSQHRLSNTFKGLSVSKVSGLTPPSYKDGVYKGVSENAFCGNVQVQVAIQKGKITNVKFLQYPNDALRSMAINTLAMPNLRQEVVQEQSANVDIVSGATLTSQAFIQSLQSALDKAKKA